MSINSNPETTGVTSLVQEACEQVDVLGKHYVSDTTSDTTQVLQDLKEYFRRPSVLYNGLATLDVTGNQYYADVDSTYFTTVFPGYATRLAGVAGWSFDMVFTLQVSATTFNQGLFSLCWQYGAVGGGGYQRTLSPALCTNIPHVRLDLAETTMVQLRVPFLSGLQFFDTRNYWYHGQMALNAILPIKNGAAGNSTPGVRIMLHLENLKLFHAAPLTTTAINFQSGVSKPIDREFENEAYPFSSGLNSLSRTVRWVGRGIPSLSSLSNTTSWLLAKSAGAVRAFGYSKPLVQEPTTRMWGDSTIMEHNADVPVSSLMVSAMASNRFKVDPTIACTDVDEMSLEYVLTQWSQLSRFGLNTTDTVGANVWGILVSPSNFWFKSNATGVMINSPPLNVGTNAVNDAFIPTNLFWWGQCFRQWRGDIEFRFTFAKTKMHAGRVMIAFNPVGGAQFNGCGPGNTPNTRTVAVVDTPVPFAYSAVFDLKDNNVFTFKVPYYSTNGYTDFSNFTGSLVMKVFDPVKASSVVSSQVNALVEVRACPGFEFAIPTTPFYVPSGVGAHPVYQSGVVSVIKSEICEHAVGESITSVKQLISLPSLIKDDNNLFNATQINALSTDVEAILPWFNAGSLGTSALPNTYDYLRVNPRLFNFAVYASRAYNYARGGTDVHVTTVGPNRLSYMGLQVPCSKPTSYSFYRASASVAAWFTGFSAHLRFPGFQYIVRTPLGRTNQSAGIVPVSYVPVDVQDSNYVCTVKIMNGGTATNWYRLRMAAADDAMLGHYMGPVPLRYASGDGTIQDGATANMFGTGTVVPA